VDHPFKDLPADHPANIGSHLSNYHDLGPRVYAVKGRRVGFGYDGEPLLRNPRVVGVIDGADVKRHVDAWKQEHASRVSGSVQKAVGAGALAVPRGGIATPAAKPAVPKAPPAAATTGPAATREFTHQEMTLPHESAVTQRHNDLERLYSEASSHKKWMDNVIDRGQGLSAKLGLHVVEGRKLTPQDYDEAHKKGGLVHIAPLKGRDRALEKSGQKGGHQHLKDLSRATIAVSHPDDIAHVTHHLRQAGMQFAGAPDYKHTDAGYRDITMRPVHPKTGHVGELQVMPLDMHQAKQHGFEGEHSTSGHKLYDQFRSLTPETLKTPAGRAQYEGAIARSNALYGEANRRIEGRTPHFAGGTMTKAVKHGAQYHAKHYLRPGYYHFEGQLARRKSQSAWPEVRVGAQWKPVHSLYAFDHNATRIADAQVRRALQKAIIITDIDKAVTSRRTHVKGYWRTEADGARTWVQDYDAGRKHADPGISERSAMAPTDDEIVTPELEADVSRMWKLECEATYSSQDYPFLMAREALQNAVDAVVNAPTGQAKKGRIDVNTDNLTQTISVADNGTGMDWQVLRHVFLKLGGTTKLGSGNNTGGYGVAKAVILGSSGSFDWTVHTNDLKLGASDLGVARPAGDFKTTPRVGTEITVRNIRNWRYGTQTVQDRIRDVLEVSDPKAGGVAFYLDGEKVKSRFAGRKGTAVDVLSETDDPDTTLEATMFRTGKKYVRWDNPLVPIHIRLNGLLQFTQMADCKHPAGREYVVDVSTKAKPGENAYPFNKGRDGLKWGNKAYNTVESIKSFLSAEGAGDTEKEEWETDYFNRTADADDVRPDEQPAQVAVGNLKDFMDWVMSQPSVGAIDTSTEANAPQMVSQGTYSDDQRRAETDRVNRLIEEMGKAGKRIHQALGGADYVPCHKAWRVRRNVVTYGRKRFDLLKHAMPLMMWDVTTRLVANAYGRQKISLSEFGSGVVLDPSAHAMAHTDPSSGQYVDLNVPDFETSVKEYDRNPWKVANHLYTLACHELAHLARMGDGHNEEFSVSREDIALETGHLLPVIVEMAKACYPQKGAKAPVQPRAARAAAAVTRTKQRHDQRADKAYAQMTLEV
jgi:hypothetical protein